MTTFVFANNVDTTLAAAASNTATTLTLASSTGLPTLSAGEIMPLTLNDAATGLVYEIVYVTAISGVTLTVERAQEGTGAQSWAIGDYAYSTNTADTTAPVNGNPANAFETSTATAGDNSTLAATTAFVSALVGGTTTAASSIGASGYQKFPSGLILQWGTYTFSSSTTTTVTYPLAFPVAALQYGAFLPNVSGSLVATTSSTLTTLSLAANSALSASGTWFAVGH